MRAILKNHKKGIKVFDEITENEQYFITTENYIGAYIKKWERKIEQMKEDKLSRTQELTNFKQQALKELGYTEINESNAAEVFEKIAEIQSRKV